MQLDAGMGADCGEHCVEFIQQGLDILHAGIQAQVDAGSQDLVDLVLYDLGRQAEIGHADPQHTTGDRQGFEYGD
jgi:hypothetical protein